MDKLHEKKELEGFEEEPQASTYMESFRPTLKKSRAILSYMNSVLKSRLPIKRQAL